MADRPVPADARRRERSGRAVTADRRSENREVLRLFADLGLLTRADSTEKKGQS
jgi:hypothetical protein